MQRLGIGLIKRLGERRHEPAPGRDAAQVGDVHHAANLVGADEVAECRAHALVQRHVRVPSTEHHDGAGEGGRASFRSGAQAPPHPERVHDADPGASIDQALHRPLGGVGLARP